VTTAIEQLQPGRPGFPERLGALAWKRELYVRGPLDDGPAVAIVGARAASSRGERFAEDLGRHFAAHGVRVVSGGAIGIDGAAHRGALAGGGKTTVVLGSGVDVLYPQRHASMFEQIVAAGGALVSLLPLGTEPRPHTFPQRNPLIAALADLVVVVEADVRSGSLSTARAAADLGICVAAVPGSRGCSRILAHGAAIVETIADADAALSGAPRYPEAPKQLALDPTSEQIASALAAGTRGVDALVRETGLPVRDVLRALSVLEPSARLL
jgi:DNA processing protein